jgi:CRP-like cAMP-binding protein
MPSRSELLERCPALADGLSAQEIDQLLAVLEPRNLAVDEVLLREGAPSESAYLIWSGSFRIAVGPDGAHLPAGEVWTGGWLGEVSLLDGEPPTATAIAVQPSVVLALRASTLERLRTENARLATHVLRALCVTLAGRVRSATDQLETLRSDGAPRAPLPRRGILAALRTLMGS